MTAGFRLSGSLLADELLSSLQQSYPSTTRYLMGFVSSTDAAGISFQRIKERAAARVGIAYRTTLLPVGIDTAATRRLILETVADPLCGGIILQLPLPPGIATGTLLDLVPIHHDPDVLSQTAYAAFLDGRGIAPPAVRALEYILRDRALDLTSLTVAIVGQGRLIGQPISDWLMGRCATLHRLDRGFDKTLLSDADLVILGTGVYQLDPRVLKPGAAVIDFGYRATSAGSRGDLLTNDVQALSHLSFYTPTPGGTGPLLVACLLENFIQLNTR